MGMVVAETMTGAEWLLPSTTGPITSEGPLNLSPTGGVHPCSARFSRDTPGD